jgi:hypothetical protein
LAILPGKRVPSTSEGVPWLPGDEDNSRAGSPGHETVSSFPRSFLVFRQVLEPFNSSRHYPCPWGNAFPLVASHRGNLDRPPLNYLHGDPVLPGDISRPRARVILPATWVGDMPSSRMVSRAGRCWPQSTWAILHLVVSFDPLHHGFRESGHRERRGRVLKAPSSSRDTADTLGGPSSSWASE